MEKINIAELLKDCPIGMELDCTIYEDVILNKIDNSPEREYPIQIVTRKGYLLDLTKYGTYTDIEEAKCVIFPIGKTTWEGFVPPCEFKDGDILATDLGSVFFLNTRLNTDECYGCYVGIGGDGSFHICEPFAYKECCGLATEEEKEKLFDAIKTNGYKWNEETKTLEKLPKFKVGDRITKRGSIENWIVSSVSSEYYGLKLPKGIEGIGVLPVVEQDDWELISDIEPKFKVGNKIQRMDYKVKITEVNIEDECYEYESIFAKGIGSISFSEQDDWELVPDKFDISTLKTFDKVLVRQSVHGIWGIDFFGFYNYDEGYYYTTSNCAYTQCIPYEQNKHLLGTTKDCDEYFKNWE